MKLGNLNMLYKKVIHKFPIDDSNPEHLKIVDFITVMGSIYITDILSTKRKNIKLCIPVYHLDIWNSLQSNVQNLAQWVSGESFSISFKTTENYISPLTNQSMLDLPSHLPVTLHSGGLDSLTGAYYNFKQNIKSDYLGFINKSEEKTHQNLIGDFLTEIFTFNPEIVLIKKPVVRMEHPTQATRSLMYFACAVGKAFFNRSNLVYLYENGVLSLNPNPTNRFVTRTTHPKTIKDFNTLLELLNIDIKLKHPFIFDTKGKRINDMDNQFKNQITNTFTCGSGRLAMAKHTGQCGVCIPCLLRKISLAAYDNEEYDTTYAITYGQGINEVAEPIYREHYTTNINYFLHLKNIIDNKTINNHIQIRSGYYTDPNYLQRTIEMFNLFSKEIGAFKDRYGFH